MDEQHLGVLDVDDSRWRTAVHTVTQGFGNPADRRPLNVAIAAVEAFTEAGKRDPESTFSQLASNRLKSTLAGLRNQPIIIDLSDDLQLGNRGAAELCAALLAHGWLQELRLPRTELSFAGACSVAELMSIHVNLRRLELNHNGSIGDEGAGAIARGLRASHALQRLEMRSCGVGNAGASQIAAALTARRVAPLEHLDLSFNPQIGTTGVEALRDAAAVCRNLKSLALAGAAATPNSLAAAQLALTPAARAAAAPSGLEIWDSGVHTEFTLRFAPPQAAAAESGVP